MDTKNYILSIQATLKGDKVVLTGLQQIEGQTEKFKKTVSLAGGKTQDFNDILIKAGERALIVAPIWMAIRTVMTLAIATISDMIKANFELEEGMANIESTLTGTAGAVSAEMATIKSVILDTATHSKLSLKELSEVFFELRKTSLTTGEALAGFTPAVNLITATNVSAKVATQALAGVYETLGDKMSDTLSPTEKMSKIADALTYTWATQKVEVSDLVSGYAKLSPFIVGTNDSFVDIVTTLGFLNTHFVEGSRAGQSMGQEVVNLSKNANQLASIFNITFDPSKPISFLQTLDAIHTKMGDTSKMTSAQSEALAKVFGGARGSAPMRVLLDNFDEFKATLKDAENNVDGFAKKVADIKMGTIDAQMKEMHNILAVLTNDFISGVYGVGDFAEAIKLLNETATTLRPNIQGLGQGIGWLGEQFGVFLATLAEMPNALTGNVQVTNELGKQIRGFGAYLDAQTKAQAKSVEQAKQRKAIADAEAKANEIRIQGTKEDEETTNHQVTLMKDMGASELDIARYRLESLKTNIEDYDATQQKLLLQKATNAVIEAEIKYRKQITDNIKNVGLELLKSMGTEESQIITMKMRELEVDRAKMGEGAYLAQMEALRLSRVQAMVSEKLKERQIQAGLILDYQKADEFEKARIRRLIELRKMSVSEIEKAYNQNPADARIIEANMGKLKPEQQDVVIKSMAEKNGLEYQDIKDILTDTAKEANPQIDENNQALRDLTDILRALNVNIGQGNPKDSFAYASDLNRGQTIQDRIAVDANVDLRTAIANINIMLPDNALQSVAEEAGKAVTDALTTNEELAKKIAKIIRPYV